MNDPFRPTEAQRLLVELTEGCHLVQAPPGTGKTQVLTQRTVNLLTKEPGATFHILALTYTTKAAENLRTRVKESIGEGFSRVNAGTFHSFGMDVLQHYGHSVGFAPDTTIYESEADRLRVLEQTLKDHRFSALDTPKLKTLLTKIGEQKRALRPPDSVEDEYVADAYRAYDKLMGAYHACDYDDLLWHTWRLLGEMPKVAQHYRRRYRYILVDEAQDTSRAQYEILRLLCGDEHRNVMMVADSDQFIYKFAGASDRWLESFVTDFAATRHHLTENFRCAETIILAANKLVTNQQGRLPKPTMAPARAATGAVRAASFFGEAEEAVGVAIWVQRVLGRGLDPATLYESETPAIRAEDLCVLSRNRHALEKVVVEFKKRGIPHLFSTRRDLVETREGHLVLLGLKVLQNPADRLTRELLWAAWSDQTFDYRAAESSPTDFFARLGRAAPGTAPYTQLLGSAVGKPDVGALVRSLLGRLNEAVSSNDDRDAEAAEALKTDAQTLKERWTQYANHTTPDSRSVGAFLGELALAGRSVIDGPGVRVLTVHVAKGLEFKAVALVGMNEGTLPDYRSNVQLEDVSDERRIAYVAVTRASRLLFLTRPRERVMPWGERKTQSESRFIRDMGLTMERL